MFDKHKDQRFKVLYKQGSMTTYQILQDTETGMNYLFAASGYAGGLTPLLDREGNPVITPVVDED